LKLALVDGQAVTALKHQYRPEIWQRGIINITVRMKTGEYGQAANIPHEIFKTTSYILMIGGFDSALY